MSNFRNIMLKGETPVKFWGVAPTIHSFFFGRILSCSFYYYCNVGVHTVISKST